MSDSPGDRLALFRNSLGLSQRGLAAALGVSPSRIGSIEAGHAPPSRAFLQAVSERYLLSGDWLMHGIGPMQHGELPGSHPGVDRGHSVSFKEPNQAELSFAGEEFAMIQRMDLSVSAGRGLIPTENGEKEALAFSRSWLSRNNINADLAVLVRVQGDSMAPSIPDGSLVLVHLPEMYVDRVGIYAFNRGDASYVKRLVPSGKNDRGSPSTLVIISDNPAFPPEAVDGEALNEIRVVGRVRCVMTTL